MPSLSGSLTGKKSPAEIAARELRISERELKERQEADLSNADILFSELWWNEITNQRNNFRKTGKFLKTPNSTPDGDKFHFKFSYDGEEIDSHWEVTWDQKKAKATKRKWTTSH